MVVCDRLPERRRPPRDRPSRQRLIHPGMIIEPPDETINDHRGHLGPRHLQQLGGHAFARRRHQHVDLALVRCGIIAQEPFQTEQVPVERSVLGYQLFELCQDGIVHHTR